MADDPNITLQALLDAATPGEWEAADHPGYEGNLMAIAVDGQPIADFLSPPDAALTAAAPRELRRLLAENERLRTALTMPDDYKPLSDARLNDITAALVEDAHRYAMAIVTTESSWFTTTIPDLLADVRYHRQRCAFLTAENSDYERLIAELGRRLNVEATVSAYDRDESGCHVLMPIPDFIRQNPRCFYRFDPTHAEYGIDSQGRECFQIDAGVALAVQLLWDAGIPTTGCCDGHGSGDGIVGIATIDDGSPHGDFSEHDPYRPVIHSAERRAVHDLERRLADATAALEHTVDEHFCLRAEVALAKLREPEAAG